MKPLIFSLFIIMFTSSTFASDGPDNSGTFTIGHPAQEQFEANLQIDRKILGPADSDITTLIAVSSGGKLCTSTQNATLENPDVLTASLVYICPEGTAVVEIRLQELERMPNNFTLGVRSAIDHFVLTKDAPHAQTILKPEFAFGLAGLTLFLNHPILEKAHIGRPHAFFYGGLSALPPGLYFLLLASAGWLSSFSLKIKWLCSLLAIPIAVGVTTFVIIEQATLSFLPVKVLGILYLGFTAGCLFCSFTKTKWTKILSVVFIAGGIVLAGVEFAVMLRWLEGQETLDKSLVVCSFYLGFAAPCFIAALIGTLVTQLKQKGKGATRLPPKARSAALIALLLGTLYTLSALLLKLP